MFRSLVASCAFASVAIVLIQCGGKPEIVSQRNHGGGASGAGGTSGADNDASAGSGAFIGSAGTGGDDAGAGCDPSTGLCVDGGKYVPSCGDGYVNPGETCDDGNDRSGDGCTATCKQVEANFECSKPGKPCTSTIVCGDKKIAGDEKCDDGNTNDHDGCDSSCQVEGGWACPIVGIRCEATKCGDGIVAGNEECDDGQTADGGTDSGGCDATCHLKDGYICPTPGQACQTIRCGDGKAQGNERCDDGNDDLGDGCTPFCQLEPNCDQGACTSPCGDGIKFADEDCDDGNTKDGDGCSSTCKVEPGYKCTLATAAEPDTIGIPIVLRDFTPRDVDFQLDKSSDPDEPGGDDHDIVRLAMGTAADVFATGDGATYSMNHKPVYSRQSCVETALPSAANNWKKCTKTTFDAESFQEWYRDLPAHPTILQTLTLGRIGANAYQFDSAANGGDGFFPIDGLGSGTNQKDCDDHTHNFNFTSEVRYWFEYDAATPPKLEFSGDDDVFVFVNHQLVMDLGGIHGAQEACFTLSPASGGGVGVACDAPAGNTDIYDNQVIHPVTGLVDGKIFEIAVFQAERNTCASNYKLTLTNFLASKSVCKSKCGDGIVTPDEVCDDGPTGNDDQYGKCGSDCKSRGNFCGDGVLQKDHGEQCDDGSNASSYGGCAPGCVKGPYCGDGQVQGTEECDDGKLLGDYDGCNKDCTLGPRCGDKIVQKAGGEECDDGNHEAGDGCAPNCTREGIE